MLPIHTILHPTDFSENARPAFDLACAIARDYGAEVVVVHAMMTPVVVAPEGMALPLTANDVAEIRKRLESMHNVPKVKLRHVLVEGPPALEILRIAMESKADLIVMGTHGRGGLSRLLMGSVAEEVMRKAPCPVLTVKPPLPKEEVEPAKDAEMVGAS